MVHILAYDLKAPNDTPDDCERVISAIKSDFGSWCHIEKSVWLVETDVDAGQVRDYLRTVVHANDVIFAARLQGNWASYNFGDERNVWLKNRDF